MPIDLILHLQCRKSQIQCQSKTSVLNEKIEQNTTFSSFILKSNIPWPIFEDWIKLKIPSEIIPTFMKRLKIHPNCISITTLASTALKMNLQCINQIFSGWVIFIVIRYMEKGGPCKSFVVYCFYKMALKSCSSKKAEN